MSGYKEIQILITELQKKSQGKNAQNHEAHAVRMKSKIQTKTTLGDHITNKIK